MVKKNSLLDSIGGYRHLSLTGKLDSKPHHLHNYWDINFRSFLFSSYNFWLDILKTISILKSVGGGEKCTQRWKIHDFLVFYTKKTWFFHLTSMKIIWNPQSLCEMFRIYKEIVWWWKKSDWMILMAVMAISS